MMNPQGLERLQEVLNLMNQRPLEAAEKLEAMAAKLTELAQSLRQKAAGQDFVAPGGMGDRVLMNVIGPDGKLKQSIDSTHN